jgi:hypothetical protein
MSNKSIWLASYWNGQFYQIFGNKDGDKVRIYSSFEDVKLDKFNETELESELVKSEDGVYDFNIYGDEYSGEVLLDSLTDSIKTMKSELAELEEMETYFKSIV